MPVTAKTEARRKRDEALRLLGVQIRAEWIAKGRPQTGPSAEVLAALKEADAACDSVALQ